MDVAPDVVQLIMNEYNFLMSQLCNLKKLRNLKVGQEHINSIYQNYQEH